MDRPIVDGRWRVHINGEGGMMVSVDLIAMVTSEASDGHERRLRAKVTSEASYGYERSELWSCSMTLLWRKVLECSSSLLTSSSLCPHSLLWRKVLECSSSPCSLRHPCVLTLMEEGSGVFFLTAHFVIPVSSLTSSSLGSHTHDLSSHPSHRYP